jgi:hypothetical protein
MFLSALMLLLLVQSGALIPAMQLQACSDSLARGVASASAQLCLAEEEVRLGLKEPVNSAAWRRRLQAGAEHYRKAVSATSDAKVRVHALEALARLYEPKLLDDLEQLELVLRELLQLAPDELNYVQRIARLQEDRGQIELAESTLLGARQGRPDDVEPLKLLAQFYARRVNAMTRQRQQQVAKPAEGVPGADGVYRVGGALPPPHRVEQSRYPEEARAAGIQGAVQAEITIDENGQVADARIVRSVPCSTNRRWRRCGTGGSRPQSWMVGPCRFE